MLQSKPSKTWTLFPAVRIDPGQAARLQATVAMRNRILERMITVRKILASISLLPILVLTGCADSAGPAQGSRASGVIARPQNTSAAPVVVAKVERKSIPIELHAIGAGQAFKTVSIESQTAGIVKEVHYRQGQFVRKGDLLVSLDQAPFLAALSQAEAALTKDKAQAQLGSSELKRYDQLYRQGIVSKEQYDQYRGHFRVGRSHRPPMKPPSRPRKFSFPIARFTLPSAVLPALSSYIRAPRLRLTTAHARGDQSSVADLRQFLRSPAISGTRSSGLMASIAACPFRPRRPMPRFPRRAI